MTDERRYDDDAVRAIFALAADDGARLPSRPGGVAEGLTLAELQAIGREVGLPPQRIADAAALVEQRGGGVRERTFPGLPIAVGRSVELNRPLTDAEWAVLVGEIRETFGARGRIVSQAGLREWSNGNLHVLEEATETGYRLRLHTTKETGLIANQIAAAVGALAVVILLVITLMGNLAEDLGGPLVLFGIALAALGFNAITLPLWARERERQMEQIAARARALTEGDLED